MEKFSNIDPWSCPLEELEAEMVRLHDLVDFYEGKQLANKKFINSVYGAMASKYFIASNVKVAEAITLQGQDLNHFSENSVNAYFSGPFQNDQALHDELGIDHERAKKVTLDGGVGMITKGQPCTEPDFWYLKHPWTLVCAGDTDCTSSDTILDTNKGAVRICDAWDKYFNKIGIAFESSNGSEFVVPDDGLKAYGYDTDNNLMVMRDVNYVMRHKVSKSKYKITSATGESITVTGDHSCMVFRDGKVIPIKAKDINPKTDKLLRLVQ